MVVSVECHAGKQIFVTKEGFSLFDYETEACFAGVDPPFVLKRVFSITPRWGEGKDVTFDLLSSI